jgi:hypothetical protein
MSVWSVAGVLLLLGAFGDAQLKSSPPSAAPSEPKSVTVPATIDHNRVMIDVDILSLDGVWQPVHAWVDSGNPELELSRRLASALGLAVSCELSPEQGKCSSPPPRAIAIGGMNISLADVKKAEIPAKSANAPGIIAPGTLAPGMKAEINLPSTLLRHYDVLIDFPERKFSIGAPGTIHFLGSSAKVLINAENGLIQIPSRIENKKYNLGLNLGASIGFLSPEVFDPLAAAHADWPHMTGAVGPANMWGADEETTWKVMRLDRVQFGPLFLTDVAFVDFPKDRMEYFAKRAGVLTAGLIGANVFLNYRVGFDYAHSMVYFDIGRLYTFPEFTVVGLTLRPEDDGRFTVLAVEDAEGAAPTSQSGESVQPGDHLVAVDDIAVSGSTMGQVWSMLGGTPGQERRLTVERGGKELVVSAKVQQFLEVAPDNESGKKKSKR